MTILNFRKDELEFYKKCLPKEIKKYVLDYPKNKEYIKKFLNIYRYNYVKKEWREIK